jgi:hypothetical protein
MKPTVSTIKNKNIAQTPKKLPVDIEIDHGNKYIISKSNIMNSIAIK